MGNRFQLAIEGIIPHNLMSPLGISMIIPLALRWTHFAANFHLITFTVSTSIHRGFLETLHIDKATSPLREIYILAASLDFIWSVDFSPEFISLLPMSSSPPGDARRVCEWDDLSRQQNLIHSAAWHFDSLQHRPCARAGPHTRAPPVLHPEPTLIPSRWMSLIFKRSPITTASVSSWSKSACIASGSLLADWNFTGCRGIACGAENCRMQDSCSLRNCPGFWEK